MDLIKLSQFLSSRGLLNSDLKPFISNPAANPSDSLEDRDKLSMSQVKDLGTSLFSGLNMGINAGSKFAGANPLLSGAGDFVNKTIGGLSPTAGLTNAASDLGLNLVGKAMGKDSNYTDSLSKGVDIASNTLSMFGPWGQGAALALKGINLIGSTKVGGTKIGENMSSTSGYSINNLKVDDANIGGIGNIFGLDNKYKKDVKAKQKQLDLGEKILGSNKELLESSGETAQRLSLRNQNKKLGTSNQIRFAKKGSIIPDDKKKITFEPKPYTAVQDNTYVAPRAVIPLKLEKKQQFDPRKQPVLKADTRTDQERKIAQKYTESVLNPPISTQIRETLQLPLRWIADPVKGVGDIVSTIAPNSALAKDLPNTNEDILEYRKKQLNPYTSNKEKINNTINEVISLASWGLLNTLPIGVVGGNMIKSGVGKSATSLIKKGVESTKKSLNNSVQNVYKINPWAFKPSSDNLYRGLGESGVKDAFETGVLRPRPAELADIEDIVTGSGRIWRLKSKTFNKTYYSPYFKTADRYGHGYIAEVPKNSATFNNRYSNGKDWSMHTTEQIPIDKANILKKDWLMGYKKINAPKKQFKTDDVLSKIGTPLNRPIDIHDIRKKYHNDLILQPDEIKLLQKEGKGNRANYRNVPGIDIVGKMHTDDIKPKKMNFDKNSVEELLLGKDYSNQKVPTKSNVNTLNDIKLNISDKSIFKENELNIKSYKKEIEELMKDLKTDISSFERTETSMKADKWLNDWFNHPETKKAFINYGGTEKEWGDILNSLENPIRNSEKWGKGQPGGAYMDVFKQASIPVGAKVDAAVHEGIHKTGLLTKKSNPILNNLWNDFTDAIREIPTESYPEIFRLRYNLKLKPGEKISMKTLEKGLKTIQDGYSIPYKIKDKNKLLEIVNKAPALIPFLDLYLQSQNQNKGVKIFSDTQLEEARKVLKFKKGGNLIPEGALHARKHELEIEGITNKGIPIITEEGGKIEQHMEIERNEIIFSLEVTKKLEELAKLGTDDAAIEAGKLLTYEIMENTEDRTNLIQTI